jgi:MYXO-CTERM domain-containing protein
MPSARRLPLPFAFAFAAVLFLAAPAARAGNLWIAWDPSTASCQAHTTAFFDCILNQSDFNTLALNFQFGETLKLAGTHVLTTSCAPNDFTCVVTNAGFAIQKYDVVMHYYGTGWVGGTNGTQTVNGILINTAYVQTGGNCDGQTCTGAHEAFEAATDGISADCCNGQAHSGSCGSCDNTCAQFAGNNGNPPWGCYDLVCPTGTYKMQLLSKNQMVQYTANGCTKLTVSGPPPCTAVDMPCAQASQCCSGLTCKKWSLSGMPPYVDNCCEDIGAACAKNTDCCGGSNCTGGKCACVPGGMWCINADECCSGFTCDLSAYKCVPQSSTTSSSSTSSSGTSASAGGTGGAGASTAGTGGAEAGTGGGGGSGPGSQAGCRCQAAGGAGPAGGSLGLAALAALAALRGRRTLRGRAASCQ